MISRLEGILESVSEGKAELRCDAITYTLLIPGVDHQRLAANTGKKMTFHTLHFLEGQGGGTSFAPRLIGFASAKDRAFLELFTTVKGMGNKKALRSLQLPFTQVAQAIAAKDADLLKSLPEIGKRLAETIIAELHGKVDKYIEAAIDDPDSSSTTQPQSQGISGEAIAVLVSLGEPKLYALQLVERALTADPEINTSQALIAAAYRLKELPV